MLHNAKDNNVPQEALHGVLTNDPLTRIPISWFWETFGESQMANYFATQRQEPFSSNSFISTNNVRVIGKQFAPWNVPKQYPSDHGAPELRRSLVWKNHLNVTNLHSSKEIAVDWIHGTNQILKHIPELRSKDRRNLSFRD